MNTKALLLVSVLFLLPLATLAQDNTRTDPVSPDSSLSLMTVPVNVTFINGYSVFGPSDHVHHIFALHLGLGHSGQLHGAEIGILTNHCLYPSTGFQVAPFLNQADQRFDGFQVSGIANSTKGRFQGFQVGGLLSASGAAKDPAYSKGFQVGGLLALSRGKHFGMQLGGLTSAALDGVGFQVGGLLSIATHSWYGFQVGGLGSFAMEGGGGIMIGGLASVSGTTYTGLQLGGLFAVSTMKLNGIQVAGIIANSPIAPLVQLAPISLSQFGKGVQIGVYTHSSLVEGVQIGVLNMADVNDGWPVGLVSLVEDQPVHVTFWFDETGMASTAFVSGNQNLYNLIGVGKRLDNAQAWGMVGGIGWHTPIRTEDFSLKTDILVWNILHGEGISDDPVLLAEWRITGQLQVNERLFVSLGPALRWAYSTSDAGQELLPDEAVIHNSDNHWNAFWFGGMAGAQLTF